MLSALHLSSVHPPPVCPWWLWVWRELSCAPCWLPPSLGRGWPFPCSQAGPGLSLSWHCWLLLCPTGAPEAALGASCSRLRLKAACLAGNKGCFVQDPGGGVLGAGASSPTRGQWPLLPPAGEHSWRAPLMLWLPQEHSLGGPFCGCWPRGLGGEKYPGPLLRGACLEVPEGPPSHPGQPLPSSPDLPTGRGERATPPPAIAFLPVGHSLAWRCFKAFVTHSLGLVSASIPWESCPASGCWLHHVAMISAGHCVKKDLLRPVWILQKGLWGSVGALGSSWQCLGAPFAALCSEGWLQRASLA